MTSARLADLRRAGRTLPRLGADRINAVLGALADAVGEQAPAILAANAADCERLGEAHPQFDRLLLTQSRLAGICRDLRSVAALPSPLDIVLEERRLPSGLLLQRVTVPLGVVGVVYEARPNVTFDVFALCFKAGNAIALKGGSDASRSNAMGVALIHEVLARHGIDPDVVQLLPPDREAVEQLLAATGVVDVIIPRGGKELIERVRAQSRVPVIETGAGVCHTYVDASADLSRAAAIVENAKLRRPTVCNALDCLLVSRARLGDLWEIVARLAARNVTIFADPPAWSSLAGRYPDNLLQRASAEHFGTEFLGPRMAVKSVDDLDEALRHIGEYGSGHSEAVVAEDSAVAERFLREVDAAAVFANASTAFTDGAEFGLGAEIGISTQKLHARGPMGLAALTSYKWLLRGRGEVRP